MWDYKEPGPDRDTRDRKVRERRDTYGQSASYGSYGPSISSGSYGPSSSYGSYGPYGSYGSWLPPSTQGMNVSCVEA